MLELARRAVRDGRLIADETSDGMAWIAALGVLGWCDDFDRFEALAQQAIDDARRRGSVHGFATGTYAFSFSHFYRGMLLDAIADAEQASRGARGQRSPPRRSAGATRPPSRRHAASTPGRW